MTLKDFNKAIRAIFYAEPLMTEEEEKVVQKFLKMLRDAKTGKTFCRMVKGGKGWIPEKNRARQLGIILLDRVA